MKVKLYFLVFALLFTSFKALPQQKKELLVIAGGHRFDTLTFFSIFNKIEGFNVTISMQPQANNLIAKGEAVNYDVILFYDSWKTIDEKEKRAYFDLLEKGVGMVFMHHALVSYQEWPEFVQIIGGKYKKPRFKGDTTNLSDFKHDIQMRIETNPNHEITANINDFDIHDEGYMNIDVLPTVTPVLTTDHPYSDMFVGWAHQVKNSRVVYLMPGHDRHGLTNPIYKEIIFNAINWVVQSD